MRIASLRGPLIALIFLGSVAMARPQQPEREVLGKEWTRRASQYSGGLQVQPAPCSRRAASTARALLVSGSKLADQ